jgi:adenylate cyclase
LQWRTRGCSANCGRTRDLQESLEYQTAVSGVLKVISRSTFDLRPVLDTLVNTAGRLCNSDHGHLSLRHDQVYGIVTTFGFSDEWNAFIRTQTFTPGRGSVIGRALVARQAVQIEDITADPEYALPEAVTIGGFRTLLGVPLLREGEPIGAFALGRNRVEPFSEKQIELVSTFADQAVIAMENARLLTETREALEQQTATAEVLQVINSSSGDLAPVFDTILEKAHKLCGVSHGSLQLYEDGRFRAVATRGLTAEVASRLRQPREPGPGPERLLAGARFHEIDDQADSVAPSPSPPQSGRIDWREQGIVRRLFVPLRHYTSLLGMIVAGRVEVRPFSDKEISLLENFAQQAVIAMENARLLGDLQRRTEEVAELNRGLEARVADQVEELGRVGRLKRFLAPQLAELIVSQGDEKILESHRREIVVVFCDLRGYTAFTETAEPEEVLDFLREYHGALGPLVSQFEGTLDQFSGDGIMVFFNDPVPCPNPAERGVKMAMAMRDAAGTLIASWRRRGRLLGFGAGIAQGYATLGQIGFAERSGYTAIGTVCNLAARLCAEAQDGQILIGQRVAVAVEETIALEEVGALTLKGLTQPVVAYNVPLAPIQPALRVIEGGPQSV